MSEGDVLKLLGNLSELKLESVFFFWLLSAVNWKNGYREVQFSFPNGC